MNLENKIVVVTGAGSGIGRALVVRFKAEGAKHVVSVDINPESAEQTADLIGDRSFEADVSSENDVVRLIKMTEEEVGPIDLFCSNAGIGLGKDLHSATNEDWQKSWDINVMSHVYAARHLVPRMIERGGGYFLNTASAAGVLNQIGSATYGVTKHAAVGFGEWLAIHHKHEGIKVSMLCPQAVRTAMYRQGTDSSAAAGVDGVMEPEELADVVVRELEQESFMILPHPIVLEYMRNKTSNYDRWIGGMHKLMRKIAGIG